MHQVRSNHGSDEMSSTKVRTIQTLVSRRSALCGACCGRWTCRLGAFWYQKFCWSQEYDSTGTVFKMFIQYVWYGKRRCIQSYPLHRQFISHTINLLDRLEMKCLYHRNDHYLSLLNLKVQWMYSMNVVVTISGSMLQNTEHRSLWASWLMCNAKNSRLYFCLHAFDLSITSYAVTILLTLHASPYCGNTLKKRI